jgi:hypothetical protein
MESVFCRRCGAELSPGRTHFYVVHIHAYADASPPEITAEDLARDHEAEMRKILAEAEQYSERELLETVDRRTQFYLCARCYGGWIENPTG